MEDLVNVGSPNIADKVFLVTGGAAGIGAAIVRTLLFEDARAVIFLDIAEHEGVPLENDLLNNYGALRAKFIKCDISDEAQLATAFQQVLEKYMRLDVVINNAAVINDDEHFKRMIDINFTAAVSCTLKALELMGADKGGSGGTVVNVSSLLALRHRSLLPIYAATKAAVLQFSNSIGEESYYAKTKLRVLSVCLGPTDTALLQRYNLENFGNKQAHRLATSVCERQRVESAATGIIEVIKHGASGSTWMVSNDKPAKDITKTVKDGFEMISQHEN